MKSLRKNDIRVLSGLAVLIAAYMVVALAVPFVRSSGFWVSFVLTIAAIAAQACLLYSAFRKGESPRSKLYGFPIARIGVMYAAVQIALSFVCMALGKWIPLWLQIIVQVLLLASAALGFLAADAVRDEVEAEELRQVKDTKAVFSLRAAANTLAGQCSLPEVRQLAEELRFCDPVSSTATADSERELQCLLDEMQKAAADGNNADVQMLAQKALSVLATRGQLCKAGKQ